MSKSLTLFKFHSIRNLIRSDGIVDKNILTITDCFRHVDIFPDLHAVRRLDNRQLHPLELPGILLPAYYAKGIIILHLLHYASLNKITISIKDGFWTVKSR